MSGDAVWRGMADRDGIVAEQEGGRGRFPHRWGEDSKIGCAGGDKHGAYGPG